MDYIRLTQRGLAQTATHDPEHRFKRIYRFISREDWIESALDAVLKSTGSRTAGVDGVSRKGLESAKARQELVDKLKAELKAGTYEPLPVNRVWIPKSGKSTKRPLGISTIRDRVVQMLLKMLLEPIFESDFLDCSHGYRPGHRTMDCIAPLYWRISAQTKHFWVIEGDITGCFDHVNHRVLLRLLRQRIQDPKVIDLVARFLKAGVMEDGLVQPTTAGVPQGGVISPLLTNVYLHELDKLWWAKYGSLTQNQKRHRRTKGFGNVAYVRYADDMLILTSAGKTEAERLRDEFAKFLNQELHLELNREKTRITHATEGFVFLGFYIQWMLPRPGNPKPWLRITPSPENVRRLKDKIRAATSSSRVFDDPTFKFHAINRVLRGWIMYYRYVSTSRLAGQLDFWVNRRVVGWLRRKHNLGMQEILRRYKKRQKSGGRDRWNLMVLSRKGDPLWLFRMKDVRFPNYRAQHHRINPYLVKELEERQPQPPSPWIDGEWLGSVSREELDRARTRQALLEKTSFRCQNCGTESEKLHVHHKKRTEWDGREETLVHREFLCPKCHQKTTTYGPSGWFE